MNKKTQWIHRPSARIRDLRFVAGCALIGTVLSGSFLDWMVTSFDIRIAGAALGAFVGLAGIATRAMRSQDELPHEC